MSTEGGTKAVVAALLANTGIAVTKFLAFLLTGASSMLAEAIHSVADSGNQLLLLLGGGRLASDGDAGAPLRLRPRALHLRVHRLDLLFSVGGLFALYEAYHKGTRSSARASPTTRCSTSRWWWVPIVVLLGAIVMEGLSFRTAIRETTTIRGEASWSQFIRRAKPPELPVILLEDFAALIGLRVRAARRRPDPADPATCASTSPARR